MSGGEVGEEAVLWTETVVQILGFSLRGWVRFVSEKEVEMDQDQSAYRLWQKAGEVAREAPACEQSILC